ncbi:hypothetical protein WIT60_14855 [Aquabacterium sp. G14]|uniref:hypothetical protein n=1 Tax=Aquabacterium sp. G14 TaxID=3130164 RepID=UPI0030B6A1A7
MNGTRPHPLSLRERMRLITTGACVLMGLLGLWSLLSARPVHGALALAASLLLVQGSIWGRKARRTPLRHR